MSPRPAIDHIRRPQILEAAAEVITERGFAATRIADVAARAGTSAPAVLYWFESREELLNAALVWDEEKFAEKIETRLARFTGARARLRGLIEAAARDSDMSLWIELWARSLHDAEAAAERRRLDGAWRGRLAALISEGQDEGCFDADLDADEVALKLASSLDGLAVQVTLADAAVTPSRMLELSLAEAESILGAPLDEPAADAEPAGATGGGGS